ncbi:MAG: hypothetical protein KA285_01390 [Bacteroidia bacterium]|nr:hypothetical protein [Bacteroidia bacterium]
MNRAVKIIFGIIIFYLVYFFGGILIFSHSLNHEAWKNYTWIFKDSIRMDIENPLNYSDVKSKDIRSVFHYNDYEYYIIVWEFKNLSNLDLKNVKIEPNVNLDNITFWAGEVLDSKSDLQTTVKYGFEFDDGFNINLDRYSKIDKRIESTKYRGFLGNVHRMALSDSKGDHQIIFDYNQGKGQTICLVYKARNSFYLIVINSKKPIDEGIIDVLNLE